MSILFELSSNRIVRIRANPDEFCWYMLSFHFELSEEFIREFQNEVEWYFISERQNLSESFIREFQNRVYWNRINGFQKNLSIEFIREFRNKLNMCYNLKKCIQDEHAKLTFELNTELPEEITSIICSYI